MKIISKKSVLALTLPGLLLAANFAIAADLTVHLDQPGATVSPTLYGIFFEDINRAGDGGLYGELLQNRSFEDNASLIAWTPVTNANDLATFELDRSLPLNASNPTSLKIQIKEAGGGRVGIFNQGFKGIISDIKAPETSEKWRQKFAAAQGKPENGLPVAAGEKYRFSVYARAEDFSGQLTVALETQAGNVLAQDKIKGLGSDWKKFELTLKPDNTETNARLVLAADQPGTVWLDMVSLFPRDTWRSRGLRVDLAQKMADIHPGLLRFPGGSYSEGAVLAHAWRWKETIGDVAQRRGNWNIWGYRSTCGLGFHEYLQLAEDLGAEPLYVAHVGMAEKDFVPVNQLEPWIQDVLDAIEYANGPATSQWGALRVQNGHPAPFHLKYVEIGNENGMGYSWGGGNRADYLPRYQAFYQRIKAAYPEIVCVANIHTEPDAPADMVDEHYYESSDWFFKAATKYDHYDRSKPKLYLGEYAVKSDAGHGNLRAALGEAAFLTGLERNADVVQMSSYAPLFTNPHWEKWKPDAIVFDNTRCYGTPSYHVQQLFANNRPDVEVAVTLPSTTNAVPLLFASAGLQKRSGDLILKVVNRGAEPESLAINLSGAAAKYATGTCAELFADSLTAENSFAQPDKISPKISVLSAYDPENCRHIFPAYSVTVLRWRK
ncbi:MAG TPA: alpha-L-arabinofuranosidase C-terminal domain-containing protein [Verrucomicrobiae bacterium]